MIGNGIVIGGVITHGAKMDKHKLKRLGDCYLYGHTVAPRPPITVHLICINCGQQISIREYRQSLTLDNENLYKRGYADAWNEKEPWSDEADYMAGWHDGNSDRRVELLLKLEKDLDNPTQR